ncbi:flagellar biosynthesis protein FlhA [Sphingomonas sp. HMWF008]|nr:flagellar biosynthesis protein FlhA [Sphingomonas sp. HMWF008]
MIGRILRNNKDLALVTAMVLILVILFSPIPPALLDLAIITNFGLGLTILLLTFYVGKPVEFSTFPSLLLVATLYRLSLNVAATRLILTGGSAGDVIGSIGTFAVQGNFVIGLVVFLILVVVQYVVVTSGAQRVSEVAARFTLDSMPGAQMSIDADLNMGLIDQKTAIRRREELEKEASFYGAMDGASKFVKGDAVAGIIILLINIIAGWIVGVVQMGMEWNEALAHFTLLTIGDGIATQLPALIISIATGIIVTRSSADKELSTEVFRQLASVPRIPLIVAGVLLILLLLPGMPKWPIVVIIGLSLFGWYRARQTAKAAALEEAVEDSGEMVSAGPVSPLEIGLGSDLALAWKAQEPLIMDRIASLRRAHEQEYGIGFPAVRVVDGAGLGSLDYEIRLFGARFAAAQIHPEKLLAIRLEQDTDDFGGIETRDPSFGLPASWIDEATAARAREKGLRVIDPVTVLITHFGEIVRSEMATLVTRPVIVKMLEDARSSQPGLVEELIPNALAISDVQRVVQNLLAEGVSIANFDLILEHLLDLARTQKDPVELTEHIRQRLSYAICHQLRGKHDDLAVLSLDPRIENQITTSIGQASGGAVGAMMVEPRLAEQLIRKLSAMVEAMHHDGRAPVLLCGPDLRRHLKAFTRRSIPRLSVLSVNEIPMRINLRSFDIVRVEA